MRRKGRASFTSPPHPFEEPPEAGDWIHEVKYDGYRTQIIIEGGSARAFTGAASTDVEIPADCLGEALLPWSALGNEKRLITLRSVSRVPAAGARLPR